MTVSISVPPQTKKHQQCHHRKRERKKLSDMLLLFVCPLPTNPQFCEMTASEVPGGILSTLWNVCLLKHGKKEALEYCKGWEKCTVNRHCRQKKKSRGFLTKLDVKQCQTRFTLYKHIVHQQTSRTKELDRDSFASHLENNSGLLASACTSLFLPSHSGMHTTGVLKRNPHSSPLHH